MSFNGSTTKKLNVHSLKFGQFAVLAVALSNSFGYVFFFINFLVACKFEFQFETQYIENAKEKEALSSWRKAKETNRVSLLPFRSEFLEKDFLKSQTKLKQ